MLMLTAYIFCVVMAYMTARQPDKTSKIAARDEPELYRERLKASGHEWVDKFIIHREEPMEDGKILEMTPDEAFEFIFPGISRIPAPKELKNVT